MLFYFFSIQCDEGVAQRAQRREWKVESSPSRAGDQGSRGPQERDRELMSAITRRRIQAFCLSPVLLIQCTHALLFDRRRSKIGAAGFEPTTSCTPSKRSSQAEPRPESESIDPRPLTTPWGRSSDLPAKFAERAANGTWCF